MSRRILHKWILLVGTTTVFAMAMSVQSLAQQGYGAIMSDTSGKKVNVQKLFFDYEWSFLSGQGAMGFETKHAKSRVLYLQDLKSEEMFGFGLDELDSLYIVADTVSGHLSKGIVHVVLLDGQYFECRLDYWPIGLLPRYVAGSSVSEQVIGVKRFLEGWAAGTDQEKRVQIQLENIRAVKFLPAKAGEGDNRSTRIEELIVERDRLRQLLHMVQSELDSLRGDY